MLNPDQGLARFHPQNGHSVFVSYVVDFPMHIVEVPVRNPGKF